MKVKQMITITITVGLLCYQELMATDQ